MAISPTKLLFSFLLSIHGCAKSQTLVFESIVNHSLPFQWSEGISFVYDNKLTLLGGTNMLNDLYTLDLSPMQLTRNDTTILPSSFNTNSWKQQWTKYPSFDFASSTSNYTKDGIHCLSQQWTINGDRIYIAAPVSNSKSDLSDFLIFDMTQNQFIDPQSYDSEGAPRDLWASCVTNNYTHIFVLGGNLDSFAKLNRIYNIQSDSWSTGANMTDKRYYFGCEHTFARDILYVFGGSYSARTKAIERYDIASDTWTKLDSVTLSSTRIRFSCILDDIGQINIYCVGGFAAVTVVDIFNTNSETVSTDSNALQLGTHSIGIVFYNLNGNGLLFSIGGSTATNDLDVIQYTVIAAPSGPTTPPTMKPTLFPTTTHAPTADTSLYQFTAFDESVFSLPITMKNHFAYIYDDKLNVFGGFETGGSSSILNKRYELDLNSIDFESYFVDNVSSKINETLLSLVNMNSKWSEVSMPFPTDIYGLTNYSKSGISCTGTCATIIDPLIYIINGRGTGVRNENMIIYNMSSSSFVPKSTYDWTLGTNIAGTCVTNDGTRIYLTGGYEVFATGYITQMQIYNISNDSWSSGKEISGPRYGHGCFVNSDKTDLFIFGGLYFEALDSIEQYDINADVWTLLNITLNEPLTWIECINDDTSSYIDYILCLGGLDASLEFVQSINILDPNSISTQSVSNGLALQLGYSAITTYNLPNNGGMLWFVIGGTSEYVAGTANSNRIQYLRLIEPPPTESPTSDPTVDPTFDPTFEPTFNPTFNPTIVPTLYPTVQPTPSPTTSLYNIYWIKTTIPEATMIQPDYQTSTISAIESTIHDDYSVYSLDYISTLVCSDGELYGWQYSVGIVEDEMDELKESLNDVAIQTEIEKTLGKIEENIGNNITLITVEFKDEIETGCDDETSEDASEFTVLGYFALGIVITLLVILVIVSFIVHSTSKFKGSDTPDYKSLFRYCTNLGDFWSDIIFVLHLNAVGSALFIWALLFTFIPYLFSIILLIGFIYIVKTSKADGPYGMIAKYLHKHDIILIGLSLIGGLFPSLSIVSSKLFHLEIFSMELRLDHMAKMQIFRFFNIVVLENFPQLVIQILFVGSRGLRESVAIISMFFSILSLLMGVIRTISTFLGRRSSNTKTADISRQMSNWLRTDTILGDVDENDDNGEEQQERGNTVQNIKQHPHMLFDTKIRCSDLTEHHRYTQKILTQLISEHIGMDEACLELYGFNMNATKSELQFYVDISLIKLMRFEVDLNNVKFSRMKNNMLSLSQQNENSVFLDKFTKKLELKTKPKEISVQCDYIDNKTSAMITLTPGTNE